MTLFPRLGMAGISIPWPFRYPQPVKMSISIASSPRLSGTGMTSLNPLFLPLNFPLVRYCHFGVSPVNYSDSELSDDSVSKFTSLVRARD